jgi:hypothetical protein
VTEIYRVHLSNTEYHGEGRELLVAATSCGTAEAKAIKKAAKGLRKGAWYATRVEFEGKLSE